MKKSKLSSLQAWAPLLTLSISSLAQATNSIGIYNCGNPLEGAKLSFWQPTGKSETFLDIRNYAAGPNKLFSGSGFLREAGAFNPNDFNVEVLYTATGTEDAYIFGKLQGKKTNGSWVVYLTPEGSAKKIRLFCSEGKL